MDVGQPMCNSLVCNDNFSHHSSLRRAQVGLEDGAHRMDPWHEQFDSISKDFVLGIGEDVVVSL